MLVAVKRSMFNVYILILMNWTFMTIHMNVKFIRVGLGLFNCIMLEVCANSKFDSHSLLLNYLKVIFITILALVILLA